ncbi:helix-turn-helix domain containing protein [Ruminococcaceae bacterium OttesenSCG-928-L11]|nr:helix-turn-helix domain containing protein [Ruminococcaceae bacterium OttesenSCG-928-L11]
MAGKHMDSDVKREILNQYCEGVSVSTLSNDYQIPKSTIYRWVRNLPLKQERSMRSFTISNYSAAQVTVQVFMDETRLSRPAWHSAIRS